MPAVSSTVRGPVARGAGAAEDGPAVGTVNGAGHNRASGGRTSGGALAAANGPRPVPSARPGTTSAPTGVVASPTTVTAPAGNAAGSGALRGGALIRVEATTA